MRHRRIVVVGLLVGVLAFLASPAGAASTGWTAAKLTKAVKVLIRADKKDQRRDKRQGVAISALRARLAAMGIDVSALQDADVYQQALNQGIIASVDPLTDASLGCPHGGYTLTLVSGDSYYICHGKDGEPGAQGPIGPQGERGAQGERGLDGAPGQNGAPGANGAPGLSAYQLWLELGNAGTVGDFMRSLVGAQGPRGDQGPQGPPVSTVEGTICVNSSSKAVTWPGPNGCGNGLTAVQIYLAP